MATIKKGTYRFNDNLTPSTTAINATIPFTVNALYVDSEQTTPVVLTCDKMNYYTSVLAYNVIQITPTTTTPLPAMLPFYTNGWRTELGNDVNTITITEDTEVDGAFATWFSANTEPVGNVIKAGTYKFKDTFDYWGGLFGENDYVLNVPYTVSVNIPNSNYTETHYGVVAQGSSIEFSRFGQIFYNVSVNGTPVRAEVYKVNIDPTDIIGWSKSYMGVDPVYVPDVIRGQYPDATDADIARISEVASHCFGDTVNTITLLEDAIIDNETFAAWFTENTTMLIKAGTYRWNDEIVGNTDFTVPISFFVNGTLTVNDNSSSVILSNGATYYDELGFYPSQMVLAYATEGEPMYVYVPSVSFNALYETLIQVYSNVDETLKGFGQIITITEDTYVPTDFGLWAVENWQEYSEGAKKKFTRLYLGDVVYSSGGKCFKRLTKGE